MTREQHQTQDAQNAQQSEYPASSGSDPNETPSSASGDDTQTDQLPGSWRANEDPATEPAAGTTRSREDEPGRSQQDGRTRGSGEEAVPTTDQDTNNRGI